MYRMMMSYLNPENKTNLGKAGLNNEQGRRRRGAGGHVPPHFQKWGGGGTSGFVPPPLLGRANVLISLFALILWLKTHFFQNFLGSLRSPNQYFLNFANLKL